MEQPIPTQGMNPVQAAPNIADIFKAITDAGPNAYLRGVTGSCRFDLTDDGKWLVNVNNGAISAEQRPGDADCVLRLNSVEFRRIASGDESAIAGLLRGGIGVQGDLAMAMRIQRLFSNVPQQQPQVGGLANG
jgi:putative sterol carrier protein